MRKFCWILFVAGAVVPALLGWLVLSRAPSVSATEAAALLADPAADVLLVDVRSPEAFARRHAVGAVNLPLARLADPNDPEWPALLGGRDRLLFICNSGVKSARAAALVRARGYGPAFSVAGGLDAWQRRVLPAAGTAVPGQKAWTPLEQGLLSGLAFGVKPLYEFLSLVIVVLLWRYRAPDLAAIRWAMVAFFLGENFCAFNFLLFGETSFLMEYGHCYGMLVSFSLLAYAFMTMVDRRAVHYSEADRRCALLGACRTCYKQQAVSCSLRWLFLAAIAGLAVCALLPLAGSVEAYFVSGDIFGTSFAFGHSRLQLLFENRLCPLAAAGFLLVAFLVLAIRRERGWAATKVWVALGLGPLGFSLVRFALFASFRENPLWADVWEEATEFLLIAGLLLLALLVRSLSRARPEAVGRSPSP